ncbi:Spy/CpxP family protein refolding chaperone [Aquipseudomonas ullengensis]|uniref:Spy/CpxP family protein refolding chaperone n=1 Tax=Aquipseudomonas ullengensis TaxID=2759166 RepID=A0A7W4LKS1_9GAMM|nr:Spy/CpxP family protein refolding chaperone [Pseudomonas ullengensis]MBB2494967.1 Spy/CpxP family protein refolding chaperone [Pseudomonas ullengensis]
MRKTLIALLLATSLPTLALATPADGPRGPAHDCDMSAHGEHHGPRKGDMFKDLNLTPEQREQFRTLMHERKDDPRAITRKYLDKLPQAEQQAMKKELETARLDHDKAVRAILTPEQQKVFDQHKQEMEKNRADRAEFDTWKAERDSKKQ